MNRRGLVRAALALLIVTPAKATSALSFEADGTLIDIGVGDASKPVIVGLDFAGPGDRQPTALPMRWVQVKTFDPRRRVLRLSFRNRGSATLPASFELSVHQNAGTLQIGPRTRAGRFHWGDE